MWQINGGRPQGDNMEKYLIIWQSYRGFFVIERDKRREDWQALMENNLIHDEINWALLIDEHGKIRRKFNRGMLPDSWNDPVDDVCPFCGDGGFDKEGLKYHLQTYCQIYKDTK